MEQKPSMGLTVFYQGIPGTEPEPAIILKVIPKPPDEEKDNLMVSLRGMDSLAKATAGFWQPTGAPNETPPVHSWWWPPRV